MIIVKMKSKERAITIPVPYVILRIGSVILLSNTVQRSMKGWLAKHSLHEGGHSNQEPIEHSGSSRFGIELALSILENTSTKQALRHLIEELQRCKGTVLVDVQSHDGTGVRIRL